MSDQISTENAVLHHWKDGVGMRRALAMWAQTDQGCLLLSSYTLWYHKDVGAKESITSNPSRPCRGRFFYLSAVSKVATDTVWRRSQCGPTHSRTVTLLPRMRAIDLTWF